MFNAPSAVLVARAVSGERAQARARHRRQMLDDGGAEDLQEEVLIGFLLAPQVLRLGLQLFVFAGPRRSFLDFRELEREELGA